MSDSKPLQLALLWHMHQPNYREHGSRRMVLPWVRLHATKDYLDMLLTLGEYENVTATFNLVPSLLDQFELYVNGGTDPHLELSRISAEDLNDKQKSEILSTFFLANPLHMIEPYQRYHELYLKARRSSGQTVLPRLFSSQEMRDVQVWSNLAWVDPLFRTEEPVKRLFAQGRHFTEEQKHALLDWQINLIGRIVSSYRDFFERGKVDLSFTPYYHPILPLLCDTRVALEASPRLELPKKEFRHPEDAERQIRLSMEKFKTIFGATMVGMWPSEGAVSEDVAEILIKLGVKWIATDEEVLYYSLKKAGVEPADNPIHTVYEYGPGLKLFFRDHALSDRIGFVYSAWEADKAAADFVGHLKRVRSLLVDKIDPVVVSVILDGENAWEYFPNDGRDFLHELYGLLDRDPEIETVTLTHAAEDVKPRPLKSLFAGSWINHDFGIWIGHHEDNAAWDLLSAARDTLVQFEDRNPGYSSDRIESAWNQILIAEGSDWCWWYGDEHRGASNEQFDNIFRRHLIAVYELLRLDIPFKLLNPIYRAGAGLRPVLPDALLTPAIDGRLTDFYEWAGAGYFDCLKASGTMHRVQSTIAKIYFAYDHDWLYIRLDFVDRKGLELLTRPVLQVMFFTPEPRAVDIVVSKANEAVQETENYRYCLSELFELAVKRDWLWRDGFGPLDFAVVVLDGEDRLERWPDEEPINLDVAEVDKEMFWPA